MRWLDAVRQPGAFFAVAGVLATAAGCVGDGETAEGTPERAASQSVPLSMLADGGTTQVPPAQEFTLDEIGFDFGAEDAPVRIVEFSDYGCGYCRRFHTETFPTLMEEFVKAGDVRWKYVTYVSGMFANGLPAAFAAECAGEQGRFSEMSRLLYERQQEWKSMADPSSFFEGLAAEVGADAAQFRQCVQEERPRARVRSGILTGARLGVRGTPSFVVAGRPVVGAHPLPFWRDIIGLAKNQAAEAGTGTGPARDDASLRP